MPGAALLILVLMSGWLAAPAAAEGPADLPADGRLGVDGLSRAAPPDTTGSLARPGPEVQPSTDDLPCAHAPEGSLAPVPPPFDRWLVVVCAAQGQALVPVEGFVWYAHGSRDPVSILALPPGAGPPVASGKAGPRYDIRFRAFHAVEATEERRMVALRRLKLALGGAPMPLADHVYQIDALSSVADLRYNIFFYVQGANPRMALACLDRCTRALLVEIAATGVAAAP